LSLHCWFAKSTVRIGTMLLTFWPCNITAMYSLLPPDSGARIQYCRWFQMLVFHGLLGPELMF
jgi:hypothetical protein